MPDDTPRYEEDTVFWPRVDVAPHEARSMFEREGQGRIVRNKSWHLRFTPPTPVHGVHGDPEDFLGQAPREKYFTGVAPTAPCNVVRWQFIGLGLDARAVRPQQKASAGLALGGLIKLDDTLRGGVRFGGLIRYPIPVHTAGVQFGGKAIHQQREGGVEFGGVIREAFVPNGCGGVMNIAIDTWYYFDLSIIGDIGLFYATPWEGAQSGFIFEVEKFSGMGEYSLFHQGNDSIHFGAPPCFYFDNGSIYDQDFWPIEGGHFVSIDDPGETGFGIDLVQTFAPCIIRIRLFRVW